MAGLSGSRRGDWVGAGQKEKLSPSSGIVPSIDGRETGQGMAGDPGGGRNIRFDDAVKVAEAFGYRMVRTTGSHHILKHPRIPEVLNLQRRPDGAAKAYQLRQLVGYVERYGLRLET